MNRFVAYSQIYFTPRLSLRCHSEADPYRSNGHAGTRSYRADGTVHIEPFDLFIRMNKKNLGGRQD